MKSNRVLLSWKHNFSQTASGPLKSPSPKLVPKNGCNQYTMIGYSTRPSSADVSWEDMNVPSPLSLREVLKALTVDNYHA